MLKIRPETPADYKSIGDMIEAAFKNVEHSDQTEHLLVERLRASKAFVPNLALLACENEQVLGYILLTKVGLQGALAQGAKLLALAPLAVLPARQKQGIGAKLLEEARLGALGLGYAGIVLLGEPAYYSRFGYQPLSAFNLQLPLDVPGQYCQGLELFPRALQGLKGTIVYPPAFGI